jgi:hypothetical protein
MSSFFLSFFLFLSDPFLPTHCICRGLFLHLVTLRYTTLGRSSLDEGSAPSQRPLPDNKEDSRETHIHSGIQTQQTNGSRPTAAIWCCLLSKIFWVHSHQTQAHFATSLQLLIALCWQLQKTNSLCNLTLKVINQSAAFLPLCSFLLLISPFTRRQGVGSWVP